MRNVKMHNPKKQVGLDAFTRIGDFFRDKRVDAGLTQADVANALGLSTGQFISNWERGISAPPMDYLPKLVKLYKVNKAQLVALYTAEQERYIKAVLSR